MVKIFDFEIGRWMFYFSLRQIDTSKLSIIQFTKTYNVTFIDDI